MVVKTDVELAGLVDTIDMPVTATLDIEAMQEWLAEELGEKAPITPEGVASWWRGIETRYEALPEVGLKIERIVHNPLTIREFTEISFRDMTTGRFVKYDTAVDMIKDYWGR